jgi:hypothetical protein
MVVSRDIGTSDSEKPEVLLPRAFRREARVAVNLETALETALEAAQPLRVTSTAQTLCDYLICDSLL